mmetsp:Transcript_20181/g.26191  ORF Transcript_20181/g.26191 Transcript_20181/m.26191 type:complete len:367 (-) Transcript_20181:747-1847(-)
MGTKKGKDKVNLYELLKVSPKADGKQIRKAYFALARIVHPDKNPGDPKAHENFQALQKAYGILKDPKKRERYDRTGCADEDNDAFWDAYERYRGIQVTEEDINKFQKGYRESKDEENDLLEFIQSQKGNIRKIFGYIIASRDEDKERFIKFYESKFKDGVLDKSLQDEFNASKLEIKTVKELDQVEDIGEEDENDEEEDEDYVEGDEDLDGFIAPEEDEVEKENIAELDRDSDYDSDAVAKISFKVGDYVKCRWRGGNKHYGATVASTNSDGTYDVDYDDGAHEKNVKVKMMKPGGKRPKGKGKKKAKNASVDRPVKKKPRVARKKMKTDDSEYGDIDALRAAILGGGRAASRAANFDAFAEKWSK